MDVEIRRAGRGDAASLGRVADDVFDGPLDEARLAEFLAAPGHLMVVAILDGSVIGQGRAIACLNPDGPAELYIDNLGVAPTARRRGVGSAIVAELIAWGRELGCAGAWVAAEPDNLPAVRLYQRLGAAARPALCLSFD